MRYPCTGGRILRVETLDALGDASSSLLFLSPALSDARVYTPYIRALLGTVGGAINNKSWLADFFEVAMLGVWYESVIFGDGQSSEEAFW